MDNNFKYFTTESPDWNFMIEKCNPDHLAANRVVLSVMTEYGLCNNIRMSQYQYIAFILTTQMVTYNEPRKQRSKPRYNKSKYRRSRNTKKRESKERESKES